MTTTKLITLYVLFLVGAGSSTTAFVVQTTTPTPIKITHTTRQETNAQRLIHPNLRDTSLKLKFFGDGDDNEEEDEKSNAFQWNSIISGKKEKKQNTRQISFDFLGKVKSFFSSFVKNDDSGDEKTFSRENDEYIDVDYEFSPIGKAAALTKGKPSFPPAAIINANKDDDDSSLDFSFYESENTNQGELFLSSSDDNQDDTVQTQSLPSQSKSSPSESDDDDDTYESFPSLPPRQKGYKSGKPPFPPPSTTSNTDEQEVTGMPNFSSDSENAPWSKTQSSSSSSTSSSFRGNDINDRDSENAPWSKTQSSSSSSSTFASSSSIRDDDSSSSISGKKSSRRMSESSVTFSFDTKK